MAVGQLIRNLFLAHTRAREIIKSKFPEAMVGANPLLLGLPEEAWPVPVSAAGSSSS